MSIDTVDIDIAFVGDGVGDDVETAGPRADEIFDGVWAVVRSAQRFGLIDDEFEVPRRNVGLRLVFAFC